ncbi:MAG TPA: PAS domain S-box protein [Methanoculleus sp.]|nr:PAS domain S-box protein [Methanoculleus sp.]
MDKVEKRLESFLESDSILFIFVIGFTTLFSFAIVTAGLLNGITTLLPHLFYIPVVFAAYRYPREGMILSVLVSSLYLVLVPLIMGPVPDVMINAYGHSVVIVAVGVIVSVLSFQLSREKEMYLGLLDDQNDLIAMIAGDSTYSFVNAAYCRYFDVEPGDLIGMPYREHYPPEESALLDAFFRSLNPQRPSGVLELSARGADGATRMFQWNVSGHFGEKGETLSYLSSGRDITSLRNMEEALRSSEEKFGALFSHARDGILVNELRDDLTLGPFFEMNRYTLDLFGYERDEMSTMSPLDLVVEAPAFLSEWLGQVQEGTARSFREEVMCRRRDGSEFPADVTAVAFELHGKRVILSILRDMSLRKEVQEKIIRSEELYRTLFENTGTAMLVVDDDGTIRNANNEVEKTFGYRKEALLSGSMRVGDIVVPEERHGTIGTFSAQGMISGGSSGEMRLIDASGMYRDTFYTIARIPGTSQRILSIADQTGTRQGSLLLAAVNEINQAVVYERESSVLIDRVCKEFAALNEYYVIAVSPLEEGRLTALTPSVSSLEEMHASYLYAGGGAYRAARSGLVEYDEWPAADDGGEPPLQVINFPMIADEEIIGAITAYLRPRVSITDPEIDTLQALANDIGFAIRSRRLEEEKLEALEQIEKNIEQLSIINDHIRNPLQVIVGYAVLDDWEHTEKVLGQAEEIDRIINRLDQRCLESSKIREYLIRHSGIHSGDHPR